jgi:S-DNA-T family DNA segregation ATPase FtsK/SpoIIIE
VAIGRVGRSLGIHLLFSSQRLDEGRLRGLESHLRYRICLRTYSSVDSKVVLGTPDAYLLPPIPGMAYLKVDVSLYERFKAALVSSPEEAPKTDEAREPGARPFEPLGPRQIVRGPRERSGGPAQMELVVDRLRAAHDGAVHQVWLPPLDPVEPLDGVVSGLAWWETGAEREPLRVPIGTLDLPAEQRQEALSIGFAGSAGHLGIVGAPRTGKSTLLRTLIASFAWTHTPDEAQFYCVDLGGGLLRALEDSPNVGGVAGKLEREKVRRIIAQARATIEEREVLFRRQAIDSIADVRARRSRGELPPEWSELADVFLVIDGWGSFRREFEGLDQSVEEIAASGLGYGVHVVLTAGRWAEMRQSLRDSIGSRLELRLHDPLESEVGKQAAKSLPADIPGRGLVQSGEHFQTALPRVDGVAEPDGSGEALAELLSEAASRWRGAPAPPVRMLPLRVSARDLESADLDGLPGVPVGVEELRLDPVCLDLAGADPHFIVLGDSESGKTNFLRLFLQGLTAGAQPDEAQVLVVDFRRTLLDAADGPHLFDYAATAQMVTDAVARLSATLTARLPSATASREELLRGPDWSGPRYYVVVDDYDLLVGPAGSPLAGLSELLAQGKDVGLHMVLARRVGGMARAAFEPVIQRLRELNSPGLVMSGDHQEGPVIGAQRATPQPPGRGYLVRRNERTTLVQTLIAEERQAFRSHAEGRMSSREVHL